MKRYIIAFCLIGLAAQISLGNIRLPRLIANGMVLQRDASIKIWGWASPQEKITITFLNKTFHSVAANDSTWSVTMKELNAGGPFNMSIDGNNHITITNILIGDVWVCSGQSNMALPMERVKEKYASVIAQAENPFIRHFFLATNFNFHQPQSDLPSGNWEAATPESVLRFTAVGYFFAKNLYDKYRVPVGLINASVGGSPAEAWISSDALQKFPEHFKVAKRFSDDTYVDSIRNSDTKQRDDWYRDLNKQDKGYHDTQKWYDPNYNASSWPVMQLPAFFDEGGLPKANGVFWFRKEFDISDNNASMPARLLLGRIVDRDSVFVNGLFVGAISYQYPPRRYSIPAGVLKKGKNVMVVRVINSNGRGAFIKDKPYELTVGETTLDLKGEWHYQLGAIMKPLPDPAFFQYKPGGLYNAMVAPLLNYSIKGVIWYQGESNAGRAKEYHDVFSSLIKDWRLKWKEDYFPFLYVQLANFMAAKEVPSESEWAELREAQRRTLTLPNTAMAVAIDVGEWNDIHPLNKEDVGKRLALAAESIAYQDKEAVSSGPMYQSMEIKGNQVILHFTNTGSGITTRDGKDLKYFAIAGADKRFVWAKAKIQGSEIIVWSDEITKPVIVRYAWADNPQGANLSNKEGLPASPFTTEH